MSTVDLYAVLGNPISHSKSPRIHTLFAAQTGQQLEYQAILVKPDQFRPSVDGFRARGGRGVNVTVPFKQDAWVYADILSPRAERANAVNTLVFQENGAVFGENTDGIGFIRDLRDNLGARLKDQRILVLGAGGAVRGLLQPLLAEAPSRLLIANRSADKALALATLFGDLGPVTGCDLGELSGQQFDLIIHGTAAGLDNTVPPLPEGILAPQGWCYDLMYGDQPTAFLRWAESQGAVYAFDGLGMLVEQAAEAFFLWRGVRPLTGPVIVELRSHLGHLP